MSCFNSPLLILLAVLRYRPWPMTNNRDCILCQLALCYSSSLILCRYRYSSRPGHACYRNSDCCLQRTFGGETLTTDHFSPACRPRTNWIGYLFFPFRKGPILFIWAGRFWWQVPSNSANPKPFRAMTLVMNWFPLSARERAPPRLCCVSSSCCSCSTFWLLLLLRLCMHCFALAPLLHHL